MPPSLNSEALGTLQSQKKTDPRGVVEEDMQKLEAIDDKSQSLNQFSKEIRSPLFEALWTCHQEFLSLDQ